MSSEKLNKWVTVTRAPDGVARVIAHGGELQNWRKVDSLYRGLNRARIHDALRMVRGGCDDTVRPVYGPEGQPSAVQVWIGTAPPSATRPQLGVWRFEMSNGELPPMVAANEAGRVLLNSGGPELQARTYGIGDVLRGVIGVSKVMEAADLIYDRACTAVAAQSLFVRDQRSSTGFSLLNMASRPNTTGILMHAWSVECPSTAIAPHLYTEERIIEAAAEIGRFQYAGILDIRFPRAPHVVNWIGERIAGLQYGLSEGAAIAVVPEDHQIVQTGISTLLQDGSIELKFRLRLREGVLSVHADAHRIAENYALVLFRT